MQNHSVTTDYRVGDATLGNVIRDRDGVIDVGSFAIPFPALLHVLARGEVQRAQELCRLGHSTEI